MSIRSKGNAQDEILQLKISIAFTAGAYPQQAKYQDCSPYGLRMS